jgi:hypothetical protein
MPGTRSPADLPQFFDAFVFDRTGSPTRAGTLSHDSSQSPIRTDPGRLFATQTLILTATAHNRSEIITTSKDEMSRALRPPRLRGKLIIPGFA